jgi:tetratricopeptide (TPR) repeat protein
VAKKKQQAATAQPSAKIYTPSATAQRIEDYGKRLEGKGKRILYVLCGIILLAIAVGLIYSWQSRRAAEAQAALGKAIEINEAQISASPVPNNPALTFPNEKERTEKAIAAFEDVANKYGSPIKEKAQYFIAVNRLKLDRAAAMTQLEELSKSDNAEVAALSKFALAQTNAADGKFDEAVQLYNALLQKQSDAIPADSLNFAIAEIYEKQGKKAEAADIYFNLAKTAREAKDAEGKPIALTQTAREAARKLEKLDADKFKQLPPEPAPPDF